MNEMYIMSEQMSVSLWFRYYLVGDVAIWLAIHVFCLQSLHESSVSNHRGLFWLILALMDLSYSSPKVFVRVQEVHCLFGGNGGEGMGELLRRRRWRHLLQRVHEHWSEALVAHYW
jgi:hypothetical protein